MLQAFGVAGRPLPLDGGQQTVWRVGEAVLKPVDSTLAALEWQAGVLERLDGHPDFRVAPALRTCKGLLAMAGWTAWRYEQGEHLSRRWRDIIATAEAFHGATATLSEPTFLPQRHDPWARADRVAWGDSPAAPFDRVPELVADIAGFAQYLLRALLFRSVADVLTRPKSPLFAGYSGAIGLALRLDG